MKIAQIDTAYGHFLASTQMLGEKRLIVELIYRSFWDALGRGGSGGLSKTCMKNDKRTGLLFINDLCSIDWGWSQLTASELCVIATGSEYLVRRMQKAIKNKEEIKFMIKRRNERGNELC